MVKGFCQHLLDECSLPHHCSKATAMSADPTLSPEYLTRLDAYWRAANYLSVGQIYLMDNPLLESRRSCRKSPRLLGHWGTTPGLNFIYAHLNRVIRKYDAWTCACRRAPGTAGRYWSSTYLEGTCTASTTRIFEDKDGMRRLFEQFSVSWRYSQSRLHRKTPGMEP